VHIYPSGLQALLGGAMRVAWWGVSRSIGAEICSILHVNFREFIFHALG
jgi:hypothetical protein